MGQNPLLSKPMVYFLEEVAGKNYKKNDNENPKKRFIRDEDRIKNKIEMAGLVPYQGLTVVKIGDITHYIIGFNRRIIPSYTATPEVNSTTEDYNALSDLFVELCARLPALPDLNDFSDKGILMNRIIDNMKKLYPLVEAMNGYNPQINRFIESKGRLIEIDPNKLIDFTLADMAQLESIVLQKNSVKIIPK